jgi:antitoxin component YwqK of YwqJK toxin-antitoxin module
VFDEETFSNFIMNSKHLKNGLNTEYFENGQIKSEQNYKDGIKDGKFTEWFDNGKKES